MSFWFTEYQQARKDNSNTKESKDILGLTVLVNDTLFEKTSEYQTTTIYDTDYFGRMLVIDGYVMTSERDEFVYHEMIAHIPMLAHPNPERVLVIGGGDGGTVREILKHPCVKDVVLCEIDQVVIDACREFLPTIASAIQTNNLDPRVTLFVGDGAAYIKEHQDNFDIILIDSCDPEGPSEALFDETFYQHVKLALKDNGMMVAQTGSPFAQSKEFAWATGMLSNVFDLVVPYTAVIPSYPGGQWTWTFASKGRGPLEHINDDVAADIEQHTHYYNRQIHRACFALPNYARKLVRNKSHSQ